MKQPDPFFSIIVPTYRRPQQLGICLASLAGLDYPRDRFEVIVVDDGGGMALKHVIDSFESVLRISLCQQPHAGPAGARNQGAACAQGDVLAFTADDCEPAADWLRTMATRFAARPDCALGGTITNSLPANRYATASHLLIMYLYSYYNALPDAAGFFTPNNLAVPTSLFRALGGFDASFTMATGEDREFCDRLSYSGFQMVYAPEVIVTHTHPLSFRTFCMQHFNYGRGTFRYRKVQAERTKRRLRFEPISFYFNLLRFPLTTARENRKHLVLLLCIAQAANAVGFARERARRE